MLTPTNRRFPARLLNMTNFGPLGRFLALEPGFRQEPEICQRKVYGIGRGKVPEFLWVFEVIGRFPRVSGRVSYMPGPILGSAFLWLCFCRQKPPCKWPTGDWSTQSQRGRHLGSKT